MYYSRAKRQTALKLTLSAVAVFLILVIIFSSSWVNKTVCSLMVVSSSSFCHSPQAEPFDLFYHLGGNGPWIPKRSAKRDVIQPLPMNCAVDQVHMISRHAERYPTTKAGARHLQLLRRLRSDTVELSGSLEFLKTWDYFTDFNAPSFENLTTSGPYAGTLQSFNTGKQLRSRYESLININKTTNFWTCSSPRDVETAKWFGQGFFGKTWESEGSAQLHIIPETAERGADTLTPGDTCLKYIDDEVFGHDQGYAELAKWQDIFTKPISDRLATDAEGLSFTPLEIYSMIEMCGFEILARGSSPWCDVFSEQEWLHFEYARDLLHFYRAGPGNKYAGAMGWLWLNATSSLMSDDAATGVYFCFVHDGDVIPVLASLGILDETSDLQHLPSHKVKEKRNWRTSDIVPMGGRLIIERITCSNTGISQNLRRSYVRMFINDGLIDLEKAEMASGLAQTAGMRSWLKLIKDKGEKFGTFKDVCGLSQEAPTHISFLTPQEK